MDEMCRLCLNKENLIPIFAKLRDHGRYSTVLMLTTGLKVEPLDGLPQNICLDCTDLVNTSLHLRNQSHQSERTLMKLGYGRPQPVEFYQPTRRERKEMRYEQKDLLEPSEDTFRPAIITEVDFEEFNNESPLADWTNKEPNQIILKQEKCDALKVSVCNGQIQLTPLQNKITEDIQADMNDSDTFVDLNFEDEIELPVKNDEKKQPEYIKLLKWSQEEKKLLNCDKKTVNRKDRRTDYLSLIEEPYNQNGPITCKVCKKEKKDLKSFKYHSLTHLNYRFTCEHCGKVFNKKQGLERHAKSLHGMKRDFHCTTCGYSAIDRADLRKHERIHTGERPYVCDHCGASFRLRPNLVQHLAIHLTVKTIQCELCPMKFKSRRFLHTHKNKSHKPKEYLHQCYVCLNTFTTKKSIVKHLQNVHAIPKEQHGEILKIKIIN